MLRILFVKYRYQNVLPGVLGLGSTPEITINGRKVRM